MESSNTTTSSMKFEHETTTAHTNLKTGDQKLRSSSFTSSSSPDSPLHDHFHNDDDDNDSTSSTASSPAHECNASAATEAPPNQSMERSASSYRIPSSVFARSKSNTPVDWSVASNESLFSLHTGNMSFTNDHFLWRSGDLGPPGEAASTSDQMFSYSAHESGAGVAADMRSHELGIAEATMKEVIKESEGQNYETSLAEVRNSRRSQGSNTSTKSFAFSVMTGDTEKGDSMKVPSTVRSSQEQQAQSQTQLQSQPLTKPEPQPSTCPEPETSAATASENKAQSKWFSCFSCCAFR